MKAEAKVVRPDDVEVQITLTARVKEWNELVGQLKPEWPSWQVASAVRESLRDVLGAVGRVDTAVKEG